MLSPSAQSNGIKKAKKYPKVKNEKTLSSKILKGLAFFLKNATRPIKKIINNSALPIIFIELIKIGKLKIKNNSKKFSRLDNLYSLMF